MIKSFLLKDKPSMWNALLNRLFVQILYFGIMLKKCWALELALPRVNWIMGQLRL